MKLSDKGATIIKHFEDCKLEAYLCPAKVPTIGYGSTFSPDGKRVRLNDKITQQQADDLFKLIVPKFEGLVLTKLKRPVEQHEFDAAVSFCYNSGVAYNAGGVWVDYSLWQNINSKMADNDMKNYWEKLAITSKGKKLPGLIRRRKSEVHLYLTGEVKFFN